jgi:8-oxo-dGTP pyrophosphatase MutT (NUDIX family)
MLEGAGFKVIVIGVQNINNNKQLLVQKRLKEPYFGYKGFISGKIRYGEKIFETAKRELKEEAGLDCEEFHLKKKLFLPNDYKL